MELHPYAQAFADGDLDGALALVTDDVVFHSPVISDTAFEGRASTAALLEIAFREVRDVQYVHASGDATSHVTVADARVRGTPVKVSTLLELDADGKVREIWVMARPLVGAVAIAEAIGSGLAQRQAPRRERALALAMKPLAGFAAATDRVGSRLIGELNRSVG
ncbi:MAG TPA: nuclear transport factor 2 family protein [Solirubrobacteraceae bacterium]|nr:nuclear transport factor 2 family protein [Solirubrobacteraceae bacterium]